MREAFWGGFVLGLLVGAGLVLAGPWLVERWAHWQAPVVALHPEVAVQRSTLRLTNRDRFGWKDVILVLNARVPDEAYTFRLAHLIEGTSVEVARASFTTRDGSPFDPRIAKAFLLSLQADTPQGWGRGPGALTEITPAVLRSQEAWSHTAWARQDVTVSPRPPGGGAVGPRVR